MSGDVLAVHRSFYESIESGDVDLMAALRASVEAAKKGQGATAGAEKAPAAEAPAKKADGEAAPAKKAAARKSA